MRFWIALLLLLPGAGTIFASAKTGPQPRPNVVYMLADDLGWSDISAHAGASLQTPGIDSLFRDGVELNQFMGWCVCSPTRAMLLTGRHPFRVGTGPEVGGELSLQETTIAEVFKSAGYRTGVFGKWHNGEDPLTPEFRAEFERAFADKPNKKPVAGLGVNAHGFDDAWVYYGGGADHFTRRTVKGQGPVSWWHNDELRLRDEGYTDDLVTQHAVEFIRENKDRPFLCYIPFHLVHAPMQAPESELGEVDPRVTDPQKRIYAAMVRALDRNVAKVLAALDESGLRENTIVVFTSDNGATVQGSNAPLRGGKHSLFEGGTRLLTTIRWPQGGLTGGRVWKGLCGACDMLPTLSAMCGIELPSTRPLDGKNVWPALRDNAASPVEDYYWAWHNSDAVRTPEWRMHRYYDRVELFHIGSDMGEARNVAEAHPDIVAKLTDRMNSWAESLRAALSHQRVPERFNAPAAPEGEVLEIRITISEKAAPKDFMVVPITGMDVPQEATDHIEMDLAVSAETPKRGNWYYSPFNGNPSSGVTVLFKKGECIDQFGRDQTTSPEILTGPETWEHRVVGLCSTAPGPLPRQGMVFRGGRPGTYRVYLDNLRLRHMDGKITPLWTNGKDTRAVKIPENEMFHSIQIRAVDASAVGRR